MPLQLLVAGGGIGGLASALSLSLAGPRVEVLEQAPAFGEVGAGIQLGPNATRRLHALGLAGALDGMAARPDALVVRGASDDAQLARLPLGEAMQRRYGAPYCCVHRADLHAALLAAVRGRTQVALNTDARIVQVEASDDAVAVGTADARACWTPGAPMRWPLRWRRPRAADRATAAAVAARA